MFYLSVKQLKFIIILSFGFLANVTLHAQTIQFSVHVASSLDATKDQDMTFQTVISGSGLQEINLGDAGMGVFAITGNEDMDVIVNMSASSNLTHSGASTDVIPFTLSFAYANRGANDINQAVMVTGSSARFKLRERTSGPAGAPPTPPSAAYIPSQATAYIYIYGSMNVPVVDAGSYSGAVDLSVTYD